MIDRIFAVIGAVLFAQFPQFYLQYLQQMSGHIEELIYQVSLIENNARLSQKTLHAFLEKFLQNSDPDIIRQGEWMQGMLSRLKHFTASQAALEQASLFAKPFLFLRYGDSKLAMDTLKNFQMGFTFSFEGVLYAAFGLVVGYGLFKGIQGLVRKGITKFSTVS